MNIALGRTKRMRLRDARELICENVHSHMPDTYILGIESSCDETAAAVVRSGEEVISNVVASQTATHSPYGGVVPELASREHLRTIVSVVRKALADAGQSYGSIDALAVTQGPGLAGSLLVGISFAKALAFALDKPLIAVNHLEGHIHAVLLEERQKGNRELLFPVLALVVSGGHTHLYLAEQHGKSWSYENVGYTRDDAAGEAFDKVAKLLGLGYPGGPVIDKLSVLGNPRAVKFPPSQIKHPDRRTPILSQKTRKDGAPIAGSPHLSKSAKGGAASLETKKAAAPPGASFKGWGQPDLDRPRFDFSYSGIKTAVLRYVETHNLKPSIEARRKILAEIPEPKLNDVLENCDRQTLGLLASFQRAMVGDLVSKTLAAAREYDVSTLFVSGGVAANSELRQTFEREAAAEGLPVFFPSRSLSTDNAAMIAAAAYPKFLAKEFAAMDFSAEAGMALK